MKWKDQEVKLEFLEYVNRRLAIRLIDAVDKSPQLMATVNLPNEPLEVDELFIKDYSENKGMLQWLINHGVVKDTGIRVKSGYVLVPKVKLLLS